MIKGSDLLVRALENEGVDRFFGAPGEQKLGVVESLRTWSIELIITRQEQAAVFMAASPADGKSNGRSVVKININEVKGQSSIRTELDPG